MDRQCFPNQLSTRYDEIAQQLTGNGFRDVSIQQAIDSTYVDYMQRVALRQVHQCTRCKLNCQYKVPGMGNPDSPIMIVGEGPGRDELVMRMPFVGAAGIALMMFLNQLNVARHRIYLTNVTHCNTMGEDGKLQNPGEDEICRCLPNLLAEVQIVQPKVIIAMGNPAMQGVLFDFNLKMSQNRGKWFDLHKDYCVPAKVICTWHPSYLIRQRGPDFARVKQEMWSDLWNAFTKARELAPDYDFNKMPAFL